MKFIVGVVPTLALLDLFHCKPLVGYKETQTSSSWGYNAGVDAGLGLQAGFKDGVGTLGVKPSIGVHFGGNKWNGQKDITYDILPQPSPHYVPLYGPQYTSAYISQYTHQPITQYAPQYVPQAVSPPYYLQGAPQYVPQGAPQYIPQGAPQYVPQGAPQYIPQGAPQYVPQGAPLNIPQGATKNGSPNGSQGKISEENIK